MHNAFHQLSILSTSPSWFCSMQREGGNENENCPFSYCTQVELQLTLFQRVQLCAFLSEKKIPKNIKISLPPPLSVCSLFDYTAQKKLITEQSSPIASIAAVPWIWSAPSSHQTWEIRSNNFVVAAIRISQVPPGGLSPPKRYWQEHRPRGSDPKCRNVWKFIQNSGNRRIDTSDRARRNLASQRRLPTSTHAERKGKKKENWFI